MIIGKYDKSPKIFIEAVCEGFRNTLFIYQEINDEFSQNEEFINEKMTKIV